MQVQLEDSESKSLQAPSALCCTSWSTSRTLNVQGASHSKNLHGTFSKCLSSNEEWKGTHKLWETCKASSSQPAFEAICSWMCFQLLLASKSLWAKCLIHKQAGAAEEVLLLLRQKLEDYKQEQVDEAAFESRQNRAKDKVGPEVRLWILHSSLKSSCCKCLQENLIAQLSEKLAAILKGQHRSREFHRCRDLCRYWAQPAMASISMAAQEKMLMQRKT